MRHLHEKVSTLEVRTAPPKAEEQEADSINAAVYGFGLGMMGPDPLMITNGPPGIDMSQQYIAILMHLNPSARRWLRPSSGRLWRV
jgi:hypothetical protein